MSATSFKPYPTLRGLFNEPKMNHRRNFLLENKLSLREKPNRYASQQAMEKERNEKEQKQILQHRKFQESYERKRSSSLAKIGSNSRGYGGNGSVDRNDGLRRQKSQMSLHIPSEKIGCKTKGGTYLMDYNKSQDNHQTTLTTQRSRRAEHESRNMDAVKKADITARSKAASNLRNYNGSNHSVSKKIQTEDIQDEDFLLDALQRCSTNDMRTLHDNRDNFVHPEDSDTDIHHQVKQAELDDDNYHHNEGNEAAPIDVGCQSNLNTMEHFSDNKSLASHRSNGLQANDRIPAGADDMKSLLSHYSNGMDQQYDTKSVNSHRLHHQPDDFKSLASHRSQIPQDTGRKTEVSHQQFDTNSVHSHRLHHQPDDYKSLASHRSQMPQDTGRKTEISHHEDGYLLSNRNGDHQPIVNDVYIGDSGRNGVPPLDGGQLQPQLTGRSGLSIGSNKSRRIPHQLGSRDNIRLPAYLEREKREIAAENHRTLRIDPDCPPGHYLLSEVERQEILKSTKSRFDTLVNELNRLPVTMDTIRVRTRRSAIEKELIDLENQIFTFTKKKVYVKRDEAGCGDN